MSDSVRHRLAKVGHKMVFLTQCLRRLTNIFFSLHGFLFMHQDFDCLFCHSARFEKLESRFLLLCFPEEVDSCDKPAVSLKFKLNELRFGQERDKGSEGLPKFRQIAEKVHFFWFGGPRSMFWREILTLWWNWVAMMALFCGLKFLLRLPKKFVDKLCDYSDAFLGDSKVGVRWMKVIQSNDWDVFLLESTFKKEWNLSETKILGQLNFKVTHNVIGETAW